MSPLEQEQLLEQTRAQIRQQLDEITELARTSRDYAGFFREFLQRVVASLNAQGGALWSPGPQGECQLTAEVNFATCAYQSNERQRGDIHRLLAETFRNRQPYIVGPGAPDVAPPPADPNGGIEQVANATPFPMFFVPVVVNETQTGAVVHVWLRAAGDPKTYPTLVQFLNSVCVHASTFLRHRQGEAAMARVQEYEHLLRAQGDLVGELDPQKVARHAVHHFSDLFGANRCSLFRQVGGRWRLEVVSNQETIDARSELVGRLCALAARLPAGRDEPGAISLDDPEQAAEWQELLEGIGARQVAYAFFHGHPHEGRTSLLLLERQGEKLPFHAAALRHLDWARTQLGRALLAATTHREVPFRRALMPVTRARGLWKRRQRLRLAAWLGVPALLLALWLLIPWSLRVEGDLLLEPRQLATVSAETTGKIERVLVSEGQHVERGDLLAKLEDQDLRTQLAVTMAEIGKWQSEANRFQSVGDEAQRKVAEINAQGAQSKAERLRFLQARTELRAPIAGTVLTKNLANRLGETLETGRGFCELAGGGAYTVDIDLRQQDLGALLAALRRADGRGLPVDLLLHAYTGTPLRTVVRDARAISETARVKPGGSFFTVRADYPADAPSGLVIKPGYTGKAKINLGRQPLAAVMMRKFLDYWRVEWSL